MQKIRLVFAALFLISPFAANAIPIVNTDVIGLAVTSIQNFDFMGTTLDVSFLEGSFDDVFGTGEPPVPPPLFLGDELAARAFVDAIVNLFNAGFGCNVLCAYVGEIDNTTFLVPYNLFDIGGDAFVSSVVGSGNGAGLWSGGDTFDWARFLQQSNRWALVTESGTVSVPEPSAVTLFALGLLGLGFARHRRA